MERSVRFRDFALQRLFVQMNNDLSIAVMATYISLCFKFPLSLGALTLDTCYIEACYARIFRPVVRLGPAGS